MTAEFRHLRDELIHQGAVVGFYDSWFADPNGREFRRDVVRHPGAASAVAIDGDVDGPPEALRVYLVRQYRAPIDDHLWEIPAGKLDIPGEPPQDTVVRELAEEIGRRPGHVEPLLRFHHSPGFCDELQFIYLAWDLEEVPSATDGIEEEHMQVACVPFSDAIAMATDGRITDGKSVAALLAAARRFNL